MEDRITFRVLNDGTVRITSDRISGANHASADALVKGVEGLMAGDTEVHRRADHAHAHVHDHAHEGHSH
jgi:hypothetical protein